MFFSNKIMNVMLVTQGLPSFLAPVLLRRFIYHRELIQRRRQRKRLLKSEFTLFQNSSLLFHVLHFVNVTNISMSKSRGSRLAGRGRGCRCGWRSRVNINYQINEKIKLTTKQTFRTLEKKNLTRIKKNFFRPGIQL